MTENFCLSQEGDKLIQEYLRNIASLPLEDLTEDEVSSKVLGLKNELLAKNNSFISDILSRSSLGKDSLNCLNGTWLYLQKPWIYKIKLSSLISTRRIG